ncbi:MAG: hypothetical protein NZO16_06960 [Deltaproteobacteria bacterium]|nr:hypothetical protein [Deltaproteobacteria bacterium]
MRFVFHCVGFFVLISCQPRGESKSIKEVFDLARSRFEASLVGIDEAKKAQLEQISELLQDLVKYTSTDDLKLVSENLSSLLAYANPTVRPALFEQIDTSLNFVEKGAIKSNEAMLLASRIYHILSSELETTKFGYKY